MELSSLMIDYQWLSAVVTHLTTYMSEHVLAAFVIIFLVAAGEAIFIVGLFVPSTVVLVGAGALVGTGSLPLLPVFLLTTLGAIVGDAISFWFGRKYRHRLVTMWPITRYPILLQKGEAFFARYGGTSVFIGRFIPGIKSVIPGIAGMMGLSLLRFSIINCVSAVAWAAVHLLPAMGVGMGLNAIDPSNPKTILAAIAVACSMFAVYRVSIWGIKTLSGGSYLIPSSIEGATERCNDGSPKEADEDAAA
jgi:membrane protein DedA with SNARE-associated domain